MDFCPLPYATPSRRDLFRLSQAILQHLSLKCSAPTGISKLRACDCRQSQPFQCAEIDLAAGVRFFFPREAIAQHLDLLVEIDHLRHAKA